MGGFRYRSSSQSCFMQTFISLYSARTCSMTASSDRASCGFRKEPLRPAQGLERTDRIGYGEVRTSCTLIGWGVIPFLGCTRQGGTMQDWCSPPQEVEPKDRLELPSVGIGFSPCHGGELRESEQVSTRSDDVSSWTDGVSTVSTVGSSVITPASR